MKIMYSSPLRRLSSQLIIEYADKYDITLNLIKYWKITGVRTCTFIYNKINIEYSFEYLFLNQGAILVDHTNMTPLHEGTTTNECLAIKSSINSIVETTE